MPSLIAELQRDALDHRVRLSALLRKAKTIAVKLDLPEFEKWVENELNGYPPGEVPGYRVVHGKVEYLNMVYGWYPITFQDTKTEEAFSKRPLSQPVAELEGLSEMAGVRQLQISLSNEAHQMLMQATGCDEQMAVTIPPTAVIGILDAVRNALLDWSLKLEKAGVIGEGMSFSNDERGKVHEAGAGFHIGTIGTFIGTMGSGSGDFAVQGDIINADSKSAILDLIGKIRSSEAQLGLEPSSARNLGQALDALQHEVESEKPAAARMRGFLMTIRSIAEGATGNLAAQGILYELHKLMK